MDNKTIDNAPLISQRDIVDAGDLQTGLREGMKKRLHQASMEIEKRLYDASVNGNVDVLNVLMSEDKLTLARNSVTCFDESPLHVAAMLGHLDFVKQLLHHQPDLASEVDSQGRSPLHLASARGYVEIVKLLLYVNAGTCLVSDEDGRTPLHLAVMKGRIEVIDVLVRALPPEVTQDTSNHGETLLHLAVKHNKLEALKKLNDFVTDDDFVNVKDNVGDTILHVATTLKQIETVKYLLSATRVRVNAMNRNGLTAIDIIEHMPRDLKGMEIKESLANAAALSARNIPESAGDFPPVIVNSGAVAPPWNAPPSVTKAQPPSRADSIARRLQKQEDWLEKMRETLIITATVIAAMAYQAGLNPPSGVWQEDTTLLLRGKSATFLAGTSIMTVNNPDGYKRFWVSNTFSFVLSLATILLLIGGVPLKKKIIMWGLMSIMWLTISSMALTYLFSMKAISPDYEIKAMCGLASITMVIFLCIISILFLVHMYHLLKWIFWKVKIYAERLLGQVQGQNQGEGNV